MSVENSEIPDPRDLTIGEQIGRRMFQGVLYPLTRSEQVYATNGMQRAIDLHQKGNGILTLLTHLSRRDPFTAMDSMLKHESFKNERIVAPIAHHQNYYNITVLAGRLSGIQMHDIVTPETMRRAAEKGNPENLKTGQGLLGYIRAASDSLSRGEVVVMAPQATREATLEFRGQDSVSGLLRIAQKKTHKIGIHLVAFGLDNVENYETVRGFNFFRKFRVLHGPTFTLDEALEQASQLADDIKSPKSGMESMDRFIFSEFAKIVPQEYLPRVS